MHGTVGGAVIEGDRLATLAIVGREPLGGESANVHALQVATGGTRAATKAVDEACTDPVDPADVWAEAHRGQLLDFVDAVEDGRSPLVDGIEGRHPGELVRAIHDSARAGDVVTL